MFSSEERCIFRRNPLAEVLCQFRFPQILSIETALPAEFQSVIRAEYPVYQEKKEIPPPRLMGLPGQVSLIPSKPVTSHQFQAEDGLSRVNLTSGYFSFSCSSYRSWEAFAKALDKPLAAFIRIYQPSYFDRVGLRYINVISRRELELEGTPFRELISPCYLGPLAEPDVAELTASRCSVDTEMAIRGGCRLRLHAGPGMIKKGTQSDGEIKFIFDQDVYMPGKVPPNLSAPALQTLHSQADGIFRGAVTPLLFRAMGPET